MPLSNSMQFCVIFLLASTLTLFSFQLAATEKSGALSARPNILLITADDMGYDDLSIRQHSFVTTPNLDALANQSVQFSDFAVTPVCSTTRAALLSGRHPYKTGVSGVHGGRDFMQLDETLMSDMLKANGYKTGTWGKWHIGKTAGYFPWDRGFDEGFYAELYRHKNSFGFFNGNKVTHQRWVSEVVTDYAIDFIERSKADKQPFFAYVSFLAPHEPWLAPDTFVAPYQKQGLRPAVANLYGMISEMDHHIGRLLSFLEQANLAQNTLVIFMSDNGPWWDSSNYGAMTKQEWQTRNPSKMNGNKGQSWQNGIRSPLFIKLGNKLPPNVVKRYVAVEDILPTILEITNTKLPTSNKVLDGVSFVPYLKGKLQGENPRNSYIASHDVISNKPRFNQWTPIDETAKKQMVFGEQLIGLRTEKYKLILNPASDQGHYPKATDNFLLFDMQQDPLETTNIYLQKPDIAKNMREQLEAEFDGLVQGNINFKPPVYLINDKQSVSVVNGFGPAKTAGNTLSRAHRLSGMKQKGDSAKYHLDVRTANKFKVYIKQKNNDSAGLEVQLILQNQHIKQQLNGELIQYLGDVTLSQGVTSMTFEVLKNNSIKSWTEISGLRRFYFVPESSDVTLEDFDTPK